MQTIPTYKFAPADASANLDDVQLAKPLPVGLLDRTFWHVPHASRLTEHASRRPFADAFGLWASEVLGMWEAAWEKGFEFEYMEADEIHYLWARAGADSLEEGNIGGAFVHDRSARRRKILEPFLASGLTMRAIASQFQLPLAEVVTAVIGATGRRAQHDVYCDMEDQLVLTDAWATMSAGKLLAEHGLTSYRALRTLLEVHGLPSPAERFAAQQAAKRGAGV